MTVHTLEIPKRKRKHSAPRHNSDVAVMFGDTIAVTVAPRKEHAEFFARVKYEADKHVKAGSPLSGGTL